MSYDEGSPFGRFCMKVTGSELGAHIMTRTIIVVGIWLSWYITEILLGAILWILGAFLLVWRIVKAIKFMWYL